MKIGIITHYYNSKNYGGNLQAYALVKYLNKLGFESEQIRHDCSEKRTLINRLRRLKIYSIHQIIYIIIRKPFNVCKEYFVTNKKAPGIASSMGILRDSFVDFNINKIKHSEVVYNNNNIGLCANQYDAFITGSDQVWNFHWFNKAFFLDFVPSSKVKISYAASLGSNPLNKKQIKIFKETLKDFKAISVREDQDADLVSELSNQNVLATVDPTLLLTKEEWNEVCYEKIVKEPYLFVYLLGNSEIQRKIIVNFAIKYNLKVVVTPYVTGKYRRCDDNFGDIRLYDVGPEKFLSLIKYAEFIFTDSFHATVFSNIFQKQYVIFNRRDFNKMGSRIISITKLFHTEDRFCSTVKKENLEYIEQMKPINYSIPNQVLQDKIKESSEFLICNLS